MEWIKEFYDKQEKWSRCYTGPITEFHTDKVLEVEKVVGSAPKKILELGSGGGQFAVAASARGHTVVAIDLNKSFVEHGQSLAKEESQKVRFIEGNFYDVTLEDKFDVVCYWDGFGIGSDKDQKLLLHRISNWLKPKGKAFIDLYTPWYWASVAGQKTSSQAFERSYGFEPYECRMIDKWWPRGDESQAVEQSLRCYSPADFKMLLEGTELMVDRISPGAAMDYKNMVFVEKAPLAEAMSYLAIVKEK